MAVSTRTWKRLQLLIAFSLVAFTIVSYQMTFSATPPPPRHTRAPVPPRHHDGHPKPTQNRAATPVPPPATPRPVSEVTEDTQLFVIWHGAQKQRGRILHDIAKNFKIFHVVEWRPPEESYLEDLWRLYWGKGGLKRETMKKKVAQCGGWGTSVVVLVVDPHPEYKEVDTAHGKDIVNRNMHEAKMKYRKWSGGGFKVHGTYSTVESEHDSFVIFGKTAREMLRDHMGKADPSHPDVLSTRSFGYNGWPSCERLYKAVAVTNPHA
eukprot:Sspe_Gene.15838::Locus_5524_Transcript_2_4_Confidence_0.222_Length_2034::g.15838::m.15838